MSGGSEISVSRVQSIFKSTRNLGRVIEFEDESRHWLGERTKAGAAAEYAEVLSKVEATPGLEVRGAVDSRGAVEIYPLGYRADIELFIGNLTGLADQVFIDPSDAKAILEG